MADVTFEDLQFSWFKKKFFEVSHINLNAYRDSQMIRRINFYLQAKGMKNFVEFYKRLEKDNLLLEDFKNFLTINVSSFFRDSDKWETLKKTIMPLLFEKKNFCKAWSAGCSIGCELYSLAILLEEEKKQKSIRYSILASDIEQDALEKAERGMYTPEHTKDVPIEIFGGYFEKQGQFVKVKDFLKEHVRFQRHDLVSEPFECPYDLILCRNVVIYFDEGAKAKLYRNFHQALRNGGVLFLGASEVIFNSETIGFNTHSMSFYIKR